LVNWFVVVNMLIIFIILNCFCDKESLTSFLLYIYCCCCCCFCCCCCCCYDVFKKKYWQAIKMARFWHNGHSKVLMVFRPLSYFLMIFCFRHFLFYSHHQLYQPANLYLSLSLKHTHTHNVSLSLWVSKRFDVVSVSVFFFSFRFNVS